MCVCVCVCTDRYVLVVCVCVCVHWPICACWVCVCVCALTHMCLLSVCVHWPICTCWACLCTCVCVCVLCLICASCVCMCVCAQTDMCLLSVCVYMCVCVCMCVCAQTDMCLLSVCVYICVCVCVTCWSDVICPHALPLSPPPRGQQLKSLSFSRWTSAERQHRQTKASEQNRITAGRGKRSERGRWVGFSSTVLDHWTGVSLTNTLTRHAAFTSVIWFFDYLVIWFFIYLVLWFFIYLFIWFFGSFSPDAVATVSLCLRRLTMCSSSNPQRFFLRLYIHFLRYIKENIDETNVSRGFHSPKVGFFYAEVSAGWNYYWK